MPRFFRSSLAAASVALTLATSACNDATSPSEQVASIVLLAPPSTLPLGTTVQLVVATLNSKGVTIPGRTVQWGSDQPHIASVSPAGVVSGNARGNATIRATLGSLEAEVTLAVEPVPCSATTNHGTVVPGEPAAGILISTECRLFDDHIADGRVLTVNAPTSLRLTMQSATFSPVMIVTDQAMNWIDVAESGPAATSTSMVRTFAPGTYIVWSTSFAPGAIGEYSIVAAAIPACAQANVTEAIGVGQTVARSLSPASCMLPVGMQAEGWRFSVAAETALRFDVQGAGLLPVLMVTGTTSDLPIVSIGMPPAPGGATLSDAFGPGEYLIWVLTLDGSEGPFSLSLSTTTLPSCAADDGVIASGQTVQGVLDTQDCLLTGGHHADVWELTVPAATTLQIDQRSAEFDSFLRLRTADGTLLASDDDSGDGLDSRIVLHLAAGTYRVIASSYTPSTTGAYTLGVRPADPNLVAPVVRARATPKVPAGLRASGTESWARLRARP